MNKVQKEIVDYLRRMARKDIDKHEYTGDGAGIRNTRDVADFIGKSCATARRHLNGLHDLGVVECIEAWPEISPALNWRLILGNDDDGDGLPVPELSLAAA